MILCRTILFISDGTMSYLGRLIIVMIVFHVSLCTWPQAYSNEFKQYEMVR